MRGIEVAGYLHAQGPVDRWQRALSRGLLAQKS